MKYVKRISVLCLIFCSLFFYYIPVFADSAGNYSIVNGCVSLQSPSGLVWFYVNQEVRAIVLQSGNTKRTYLVSTEPFITQGTSGASACPFPNDATNYNSTLYNVDGINYYASYWTGYIDNTGTYDLITSFPSNYIWQHTAIYYTYGAGAIAPEDNTEWGDLVDVGYNTQLAGTGTQIKNNIDTISWNPYSDDNGNLFTDDCMVEIRAVPGYYGAADRQSLLTQTANDFIKDLTNTVSIASVAAETGSFSISWGQTVDYLSSAYPFSIQSLSSLVDDGSSWIKKGWVYQYRLVVDEYQSEWKDIYTLTSSGVQNDLTVINVTTIDQSLIDVQIEQQEINTDINISIEYNDVVIPDIPRPEPTPVPTQDPEDPCTTCNVEIPDNSDWFLAIINTIRTTINGLKETVNGLWGVEPEYLDSVDPEEEKQKFLDMPYFSDAADFMENIKDTWDDIENAEPVLHFDGITVDQEEFIPPVTINLNDVTEQMGFQEYHELAYSMTDGIIYLSLFVLLINKIRHATKGAADDN